MVPRERFAISFTFFILLILSTIFAATADSGTEPAEPIEPVGDFESLLKLQQDLGVGQHAPIAKFASNRETPRFREEKQRLSKEICRKHGNWGDSHPRKKILDALYGFSRYFERNSPDVARWEQLYGHVSKKQKRLLERTISYAEKFKKAEKLLQLNQALCDAVLDEALQFYDISRKELDDFIRDATSRGVAAERIPISQSLKHIGRDWADDGAEERAPAFNCILDAVRHYFPKKDDTMYEVLLPGAGLGRLGFEVASLGGFEVTNNEVSSYMNVMYRFLESQQVRDTHKVAPFVEGWSHHATNDDQFLQLSLPSMTMNNSNVILVEGDFTTVFKGSQGKFDIIITHFFIDTARNLMAYFDTIKFLLKEGGFWINFGPLLYGSGPWVQLSLEEILKVTEGMGFVFQDAPESCGSLTFPDKKVRGIEARYGFSPRALTRNAYLAQSWVARKG